MQRLASRLEQVIQQDIGNRGIKHFASLSNGNLFKTCDHMFHSAKHVGVCTGFNIPPPENDGPLGALWIAHGCLMLGKKVTLITDDGNGSMIDSFVSMYLNRSVGSSLVDKEARIRVVKFPARGEQSEQEALQMAHEVIRGQGNDDTPIDHLLSIERVGPSQDHNCYSMRGRNITHLNGRVESMFYAAETSHVFTSGIGDGGNEIGMANVKEQVCEHIPNGSQIACSVGCNSLMICGVSNWAGYAICLLLQMMSKNGTEVLEPWVSSAVDRQWLAYLTDELKVVDGVRGKPDMSVDGLDYDEFHGPLIDQLVQICRSNE